MKPYKNLRSLHPELFELWYRVLEEQPTEEQPLTIELATTKDAVQTRKRLYYARRALIEEGAQGSARMVSFEVRLIGERTIAILHPSWIEAVRKALGPSVLASAEPAEPAPLALEESIGNYLREEP